MQRAKKPRGEKAQTRGQEAPRGEFMHVYEYEYENEVWTYEYW
jgi:hypothetical protein